jgi:hypothetical protein
MKIDGHLNTQKEWDYELPEYIPFSPSTLAQDPKLNPLSQVWSTFQNQMDVISNPTQSGLMNGMASLPCT